MPPKAKAKAKGGSKPSKHVMATELPPGTVLTDFTKREWKLGHSIGSGGFGLIYLADRNHAGAVGDAAEHVIKVEPHQNGPLFCEMHFYQRVAKAELISAWKREHRMSSLGMPQFVASGVYTDASEEKYRFMVMERFGSDLQKLFETCGKRFPRKTVLILGIRLLEVLEFIHNHDYVHADIKASNLLLGYKQAKQVYLVDYGLAFRYIHDGKHKAYKVDPKWKHNGTIEFTSRDAHDGLTPSRRGDLEILAYCMVQWLCSTLPWEDNLTDCAYVQQQKQMYMDDIPLFMKTCFPTGDRPEELAKLLQYVNTLEYHTKPDYAKCKNILKAGLKKLGQKDDGKLDFAVPKGRKRKSLEVSHTDTDDDDIVISPKARKVQKTSDGAVPNGTAARGKKGKGTAPSPRASATAVKKGKSTTAAATTSAVRKVKTARPIRSPTALAAVPETANAAAVRKKKLKASVACQTSPGLKGLKRSRKS